MNLLLLQQDQLSSSTQARVTGRQAQHIRDVLKGNPGDQLKIGLINGAIGTGTITAIHSDSVDIGFKLDTAPPPPLPLTLLLALPRPKMLKRILQSCATLGVKKIFLINSYRVEKSYWQTPWLAEDIIHEQLLLGLEQARDTQLPEVLLRKRFKPFVEDELPALIEHKTAWIAHPQIQTTCKNADTTGAVLAIGPEGGFIPYEVDKFTRAGFQGLALGPRILKVETAIPVAITQLFPH